MPSSPLALTGLPSRKSLLSLDARLIGALLLGVIAMRGAVPCRATQPARPNVVLMMADDMGYSDLGCYGSEIDTPNLDRLAQEGVRFTQFYNTGRCWPTRGALLTGYYAQAIRRDQVPGVRSGGRGTRPKWAPLLPKMLAAAGYRSYHVGKWHIDGMPCAEGFDRSYYLRDQQRFFSPTRHFLDDQPLPPVQRGSGFYGTTAIADRAVQFLQEHDRGHQHQPFFLYVAFTAPHFPLHALPQDIAKYEHRYDDGWEKIRAARWRKIQQLGLVSGRLSDVERNIGPPYDFPKALEQLGSGEVNRPLAWNTLTQQQQQFQSMKMSLHAAMVDRIDQEVGRILKQLAAMNAMDNTLILFLSDNGASAEIMIRGDGHDPHAPPGSADTHYCLGPGWSTCSNTPFRRHKTWVHEGGIATPLIAHWPARIRDGGRLRHTPGHVVDLVPTILELAGVQRRPEVAWHGTSLVRALANDANVPRDSIWWLHEGNRALRQGNWKIVAARDEAWELFDLASDRAETENLAASHPAKLQQLIAEWERQWTLYQQLAKNATE